MKNNAHATVPATTTTTATKRAPKLRTNVNAGIAFHIGGWTFGQVPCEGGTVWGATDGKTVYTL